MGSLARIGALSAGVVLLGILYAVTLFPQITNAVGSAADAMCNPVKMECGCMMIMKEGKCVGGPNMYTCPCFDVTSGFKTSGVCMAPNKCLGQDTGGMMPMLPMIPMPMMMPMMEMPQDPCMQPGAGGGVAMRDSSASSTSATSTQANPCSFGGGGYGGFGSEIFDTSAYYNSSSENISGSLFDDLNQPKGGVSNFLVTSSSTGGQSGGEAAPVVPTGATSKLTGVIKVGEAGATILANLRDGVSEVAGFFGGGAFGPQASQSVVGRLCATRPWAKTGLLASLVPNAFFDTLCTKAGYQVGVVTPQRGAGGGSTPKKATQPAPAKIKPGSLGPVEVDIWAEPASVRLGTRTYIFWNSKGVLDCTVTGPNFTQTGVSGGASTVPLSGATTYSIECAAPDGTKASDTVTVHLAI